MNAQTTTSKIVRSVVAPAALWLGGFLAHGWYIDEYYWRPAEGEWFIARSANDLVAAQKAIHKREVADCRRADLLWFIPFDGKCADFDATL